jgi:hypothetical protein
LSMMRLWDAPRKTSQFSHGVFSRVLRPMPGSLSCVGFFRSTGVVMQHLFPKKRARIAELKRGTFIAARPTTSQGEGYPKCSSSSLPHAHTDGIHCVSTIGASSRDCVDAHTFRHLPARTMSKERTIFTVQRKFY